MDIMMPEMDGIATMRDPQDPSQRSLPIIAVTAKAMKAIERSASRQRRGTICPSLVETEQMLGPAAWLYR
jgi:CheY-like chemotaxis protein